MHSESTPTSTVYNIHLIHEVSKILEVESVCRDQTKEAGAISEVVEGVSKVEDTDRLL
jgi:hypothetical protein